MVAWLSDWLRDIIAIILLAVLVELLLPNKAMQRYARLVVGLFILLTILSPILKLVQSDIGSKLDEGMKQWSDKEMASKSTMTSLAKITQDGEQMSENRNLEAAKLMEKTLEASIQNEVTERTKATVDTVDVLLKWVNHSGKQIPYINGVIVTLKAAEQKKGLMKDGKTVEEVMPVIVDIEMEQQGEIGDQSETNPAAADDTDDSKSQHVDTQWSEVGGEMHALISGIIVQGWGVDAKDVVIRQPAVQSDAR